MRKYTTSQRLKEIMLKKNIKQIDILNKIQPICKKWGIKMGSNDLSQYVTGKVEPSQKKLSVLAEVLDTNEVWLMGYDVPMDKNLTTEEFTYSKEQYTTDIINYDIENKFNNLNYMSIKTGIEIDELKKILTGENKLPKPIYLKKIADILEQNVMTYFVGYGYVEDTEIDNDIFSSGIRFLLKENDRHDLCSILQEEWKKQNDNISEEKIYSNLFGNEKEEFSSSDIISILSNNTIKIDNGTFVDVSSNTIKIPVLGTIKAGIAIEAQQNILEYIEIPKDWTRGGKVFYGLQISGDSMYPKYSEKDIVIFEQSNDIDIANKKDCAVMVNGFDATFKNVTITEDGITLVPFNLNNSDGYTPIFYNKEQIESLPVRIIGIAREKRTRL